MLGAFDSSTRLVSHFTLIPLAEAYMFNIFRPRPRRSRNDVVADPFAPFPRANYAHQADLSAADVLRSQDARQNLHFAARIASREWRRIEASKSWEEVDEHLFQLAVLDKFIEL